jgi:thiol-disulfide isomerase/thioredoxin
MAAEERTVLMVALYGITLTILFVVFFVLPHQTTPQPSRTECEARFVSWCAACNASNWSESIKMPADILCMEEYNPINMPIFKDNTTCSYAKPICSYYGIKQPESNRTENVTEKENRTQNSSLNQTENTTGNSSCEVIEFYGSECPHCQRMIPIVEEVENETGIKFTRLEIWHNSTNQGIFQSYSSSIQRDCGMLIVPTFTIPKANKSICGEQSGSDLKYFVTSNCGET